MVQKTTLTIAPKFLNTGNEQANKKINTLLKLICGNVEGLVQENGELSVLRITQVGNELNLLDLTGKLICSRIKQILNEKNQSMLNKKKDRGETISESDKNINQNILENLIHFFQTNLNIYSKIKRFNTYGDCDKYLSQEFPQGTNLSIFTLNTILGLCVNADECELAIKKYGKGLTLDNFSNTIISYKCNSEKERRRLGVNSRFTRKHTHKKQDIEGDNTNNEVPLEKFDFDDPALIILSKKYGQRLSREQIIELQNLIKKEKLGEDFALGIVLGHLKGNRSYGNSVKNKIGGKFIGKGNLK